MSPVPKDLLVGHTYRFHLPPNRPSVHGPMGASPTAVRSNTLSPAPKPSPLACVSSEGKPEKQSLQKAQEGLAFTVVGPAGKPPVPGVGCEEEQAGSSLAGTALRAKGYNRT